MDVLGSDFMQADVGRKSKVKNLQIKIGGSIVAIALCGFFIYKQVTGPKAMVSVYRNAIRYDNDNQITGSLSYEKATECLKVVVLEQSGVLFQKLMYVENYLYNGSNRTHYIDFEKNWSMATFQNSDFLVLESSEEDIQIVYEESLMPYLLKEVGLQKEYEATEILDAFDQVPDLRNSTKEAIKLKEFN